MSDLRSHSRDWEKNYFRSASLGRRSVFADWMRSEALNMMIEGNQTLEQLDPSAMQPGGTFPVWNLCNQI